MIPRCDLNVGTRTKREPSPSRSCDSSSDVGGVKTLTRAEEVDAADETVLTEELLATDGVGEALRALKDSGELGTCENGKSKPEKRKSMLSRGDSRRTEGAFRARFGTPYAEGRGGYAGKIPLTNTPSVPLSTGVSRLGLRGLKAGERWMAEVAADARPSSSSCSESSVRSGRMSRGFAFEGDVDELVRERSRERRRLDRTNRCKISRIKIMLLSNTHSSSS